MDNGKKEVIVNKVLYHFWLLKSIIPFISSTMALVMDIPSPVPGSLLIVELISISIESSTWGEKLLADADPGVLYVDYEISLAFQETAFLGQGGGHTAVSESE